MLNQNEEAKKASMPDWRERQYIDHGQDPLICENCTTEMVLVAVCYGHPEYRIMTKLGFDYCDRIAKEQFQFIADTS